MAEEIETVHGEVVALDERTAAIAPVRPVLPPTAVQAAAVAATGFAAGMATVAVVRKRRVRRAVRKRSAIGKVVASRSFLVDVHVLGDRG